MWLRRIMETYDEKIIAGDVSDRQIIEVGPEF